MSESAKRGREAPGGGPGEGTRAPRRLAHEAPAGLACSAGRVWPSSTTPDLSRPPRRPLGLPDLRPGGRCRRQLLCRPSALPPTCLPLRVRQPHTTMLHRYVTAGRRCWSCRSRYPRETERPGWAGRCGRRRRSGRAFRRATTRVPRKARLAHAATVGTSGVGSCARRAWRRRYRARGPRSGWALTLGRARILRAASQRRATGETLRMPTERRHSRQLAASRSSHGHAARSSP